MAMMRATARDAGKARLRGGRGVARVWRRLIAALRFFAALISAAMIGIGAAPASAYEPGAAEPAAAATIGRRAESPPALPNTALPNTAWLKTFASAPVDAGAPFLAPDYYGSLIEGEARASMRDRLLAHGLLAAATDDPDAIAFSIKVEEPKPALKRPPKSRLQLESIETDPTDNIRDPEVRPVILLGPRARAVGVTPMIAVTIYARRGDERLWSGYAAAPSGGAARAAIARALTEALIDRYGESVDIPEFSLAPPAAAPDSPAQNGPRPQNGLSE
jgi:hypothetical protein